jgi:hypothetical protein
MSVEPPKIVVSLLFFGISFSHRTGTRPVLPHNYVNPRLTLLRVSADSITIPRKNKHAYAGLTHLVKRAPPNNNNFIIGWSISL